MDSMRKAGFAAILLCSVLGTGCGDIFRPVAVPIGQPPGGDPQARRHALVVNNAGGGDGTLTAINVSGDTIVSNRAVGAGPVHATFTTGATRVFVANQSDDSLSALSTAFFTQPVIKVTLPAGAAPSFVLSPAPSVTYAALTGLDAVGVIRLGDVLTDQVAVGAAPVALAGIANGARVYSVNRDSNTVTAIRTGDLTVAATIPVGDTPVWAVMNPEGTFLYVLNQASSTVSVINTATDTVSATLSVGAAPESIYFDNRLRRLYVPNTGGNTVHIFKADVPTPELLAEVTVGPAPRSVVALEDGLRAYVANSGSDTVSVLSSTSNTVIRTITVGAAPVWMAASPDATKVYSANRGADSISIIRTSDDSVSGTIASGSPQPVFVLVTP